ncbi:MAG: GNAT family N-acetyltransferase [Anaerolineales bacterium]|nr:GNAT family N-acetyltransferase [Anaerolineales bacterium]
MAAATTGPHAWRSCASGSSWAAPSFPRKLKVSGEVALAGATPAVAVHLLLACLARGLHPNWDAANPESVKLATKLGYRSTGSYEAYFHTHRA